MPIRPFTNRYYGDLDDYTPGQELIYRCETETQSALPGFLTFEQWADVIDEIWYKVRSRLEYGPVNKIRGRTRLTARKHPDPDATQWDDRYYEKEVIPMDDIPLWIEKHPPNIEVTWTALWSEPNLIVAGNRPLHIITAVHEVAHAFVYYKHGWGLDETDNGHGPIWKATYLDLLNEFLPKHAAHLHASFKQRGIDI